MTDLPAHPLRIAHIAYTFYESDNRVMRYAQALVARGDQVDVIALRPKGHPWRTTHDGVRLYQIQRRATTERRPSTYLVKTAWFWWKSMTLISCLELRRRYDVVHVHNIPDFLVFGAWLPKLMGARVILDVHDIVPELYAGKFAGTSSSRVFRLLTTIEHACCSFADHVLVSNVLWHHKLTSRSVPASKCTPFLNYPDLNIFKPANPKKEPGESPFVILYPGSLNYHQGVDIALRAFALVRQDMPGAFFHIYGRGPGLVELKALAHQLSLDESVSFMEPVSLTRIAEEIASASVGVVPKRSDGFGNEAFSTKILEFMASGVPVIVSRTKVDDYYFDDGLVDFFEAGSVTDLSRVLLRAYQHRHTRGNKLLAARDFALRHSWQVHSREYALLIDSLTAKRRGKHSRSDSRKHSGGVGRQA